MNGSSRIYPRQLESTHPAGGQGHQPAEQHLVGEQAHQSGEVHHHHSHTGSSQHVGGHHLLQVENLSVSFRMYDSSQPFFRAGHVQKQALRNLTISVHEGEIVAVVGASGSGKTLLANAILGMNEPNAAVTGTIWFDGVQQTPESLAQLRGHGISLVPQSVAALDPMMKVGKQVSRDVERVADLFGHFNLPPNTANLYPHQLSGGMARRVLLCCALADNPRVIIADEPTPGLDLDLALRALKDFRAFANSGGGVMLITHDIELALHVADRVAVFKDGTIVEETAVENFAQAETLEHPFTRALWYALPEHDFACMQSVAKDGGVGKGNSKRGQAHSAEGESGAACTREGEGEAARKAESGSDATGRESGADTC